MFGNDDWQGFIPPVVLRSLQVPDRFKKEGCVGSAKDIFPLCPCGRKKYFNNEAALTELNKFDDLMRRLSTFDAQVRRTKKNPASATARPTHPECPTTTDRPLHGSDRRCAARFLAREVPNFVHVTVGDENFEVFKRAWCVAA